MDGSTRTRKATGDHAEGVAARYLQTRGVTILARNVFSRGGEIDLIGRTVMRWFSSRCDTAEAVA